MGDEPERLFVYGTLRPGAAAWPLLEPAAERHVPAAVTGELYDTGAGYPAFVAGHGTVHGDVVTLRPGRGVEMLERLDRYEGVDEGLYARERIEAATAAGAVSVWIYRFLGPVQGMTPVAGADFLAGGGPAGSARNEHPEP